MNSNVNGSSNNKPCSQGVKPKGKHYMCNKGNKSSQLSKETLNDSACQEEKIDNIQNGASCSYHNGASCSSLPSSPLSPLNKIDSDLSDANSVDLLTEKFSPKEKTLSSEENDLSNHDKKRKTGGFIDDDSSSSAEGDEGLSGDDYCIYTYKGDQFADLPNSFFSVDMGNEGDQPSQENLRGANYRREMQQNENERSNAGSSPEMDFLEMDFDPGPSLEQDSEEDFDSFDRKLDNVSPVPDLPCEEMVMDNHTQVVRSCMSERMETYDDHREPRPGTSKDFSGFSCTSKQQCTPSDCNSNNFNRTNEFLSDCCTSVCSFDWKGQNGSFSSQKLKEDMMDESESDSLYTCQFSGKRLDRYVLTEKDSIGEVFVDETDGNSKLPFDGIMLWTEQEAISKQVTLVSPEVSCGVTAVINVMLALRMRISVEKVKEGISYRLRSESSSIPQYLVSRSFAGVGYENLIRGIHHASQGALYARFFQMYPKRDIFLSRWLSHWMKKGAVPILTTNVQRDAHPEDSTEDTRHHQMIFGVSSKGVYLTNPLECLQDEELWRRLTSPSILRIKRSDIVSRWTPGTDLKPLMFQNDDRWKKMNVLGQVVNIIRESPDPEVQGKFFTQYISIPASSGITLVIPRESSGYEELVSTPDLRLFSPKTE